MLNPACDRCGRMLERLDLGAGATLMVGRAPVLYPGVVCASCGKLECPACKGQDTRAPCSWCGGQVDPAYEHLLRRAGGRDGVAATLALEPTSGWLDFAYAVGFIGGLGGLLGAIMLFPLGDDRLPQSVPASILAGSVGVLSFALAGSLFRSSGQAVSWLRAWCVSLSVLAGFLEFHSLRHVAPPRQPAGVVAAAAAALMMAALLYLVTWPISRALRRRLEAGE